MSVPIGPNNDTLVDRGMFSVFRICHRVKKSGHLCRRPFARFSCSPSSNKMKEQAIHRTAQQAQTAGRVLRVSVHLHFVQPYLQLLASDVPEVTCYCCNMQYVSSRSVSSNPARIRTANNPEFLCFLRGRASGKPSDLELPLGPGMGARLSGKGFLSKASRTALTPTQPPRIKRPRLEADHVSEVNDTGHYPPCSRLLEQLTFPLSIKKIPHSVRKTKVYRRI
jgi:hypothetical protein